MPSSRFVQFDVFTDKPFSGNPLAVFPEAEGINDERMMQIAREMNLSETVFVLESEKEECCDACASLHPCARFHLRVIRSSAPGPRSPAKASVPLPEGGTGWQRIHHEVGIGVLPVDIEFKDGQAGRRS